MLQLEYELSRTVSRVPTRGPRWLACFGRLWNLKQMDPWGQIFLDRLPYFSEHRSDVTGFFLFLLPQTLLHAKKLLKSGAKIPLPPKDASARYSGHGDEK